MYGRGAHGKLTDSGDWREKIDLQNHRYMLEDTRLRLSFLVPVGRWAGVPAPVAQGLLSVAAAASGRDLYGEGRTLEALGLAELSVAELQEVLQRGSNEPFWTERIRARQFCDRTASRSSAASWHRPHCWSRPHG